MSVNTVFVLVMIGYSALNSNVTEVKEMSWHTSLTDCHAILNMEISRGRGQNYNENYVCLPVQDALMRNEAMDAGRYSYPRRYGTNRLLQ